MYHPDCNYKRLLRWKMRDERIGNGIATNIFPYSFGGYIAEAPVPEDYIRKITWIMVYWLDPFIGLREYFKSFDIRRMVRSAIDLKELIEFPKMMSLIKKTNANHTESHFIRSMLHDNYYMISEVGNYMTGLLKLYQSMFQYQV